jgi:hypothetical protein
MAKMTEQKMLQAQAKISAAARDHWGGFESQR